MNLPAIPLDKQAHLFSGACIAFTAAICLVPYLPEPKAIACGFAAAVFAGLAKEVWDHFHPATHTMDAYDFFATAAGGAAASLVLYIA
jgi:hypothetical protein